MIIKYTNNGLEVQANTAIKYKNTSRSLAGELFNSSITLSYSCVSCRGVINDKLFLKKGAWNVNITTTRTANQQLELVKDSNNVEIILLISFHNLLLIKLLILFTP